MKKTILLGLMLVMAGCSFSKKSSEEAQISQKNRVDEVMRDERYSNLRKVEVSIKKGLWDVFQEALPKLSVTELNSITTDGETLGAVALRTERIDFLEALLKAGMSPFRESFNTYGERNYPGELYRQALRMQNNAAIELVKNYRNKYLTESARLCATSITSLVAYLERNYISPSSWVCGQGMNLFKAVMGRMTLNQREINEILKVYLDVNRTDSSRNLSEILELSLYYSNEEALTRFDIYCSAGTICKISDSFDLGRSFLNIEEAIKKLILLKRNFRNHTSFVLETEKALFARIKYSLDEDRLNSISILERFGLKVEYERLEPDLIKPWEPGKPGDPLPPPPVREDVLRDEYGQSYSE